MRSHSILPTPTPARSGALTPKPSANAAAPGKPAPHAVHKQAAERIRSTVQQNRARPNSLEAIRAKVKAEMKAEAAESKARTLEKLAVEEEEQRKVTEAEAAERQAMRREARAVYSREMQRDAAERADAPPPPPVAASAAAPAAEGADGAPSGTADGVQALLRDRAEDIREISEAAKALKERMAARRGGRDRWGEGPNVTRPLAPQSQQPAAADIVNRSLFQWAPPPPAAPAAAAAPAVAPTPPPPNRNAAAQAAWEWLK